MLAHGGRLNCFLPRGRYFYKLAETPWKETTPNLGSRSLIFSGSFGLSCFMFFESGKMNKTHGFECTNRQISSSCERYIRHHKTTPNISLIVPRRGPSKSLDRPILLACSPILLALTTSLHTSSKLFLSSPQTVVSGELVRSQLPVVHLTGQPALSQESKSRRAASRRSSWRRWTACARFGGAR